MQIGEVDNVAGVPVAVTTKMPTGTAVILDTKIAVLAFLRMGMEILFNPYADWAYSHNAVQFRGEIRDTIGVAYPAAINVITNLNYWGYTSDGSSDESFYAPSTKLRRHRQAGGIPDTSGI